MRFSAPATLATHEANAFSGSPLRDRERWGRWRELHRGERNIHVLEVRFTIGTGVHAYVLHSMPR
jgi:hypothetical protein